MNVPAIPRTLRHNGFVCDWALPRDGAACDDDRAHLVFLHGAFGGRWYLRRLLARMSAHGYPALSFDLKGHGARYPDPALGRYRVEDYVADALEALRGGIPELDGKRVILVGHSMGGLVAKAIAQEFPTAALILITPAPPRGIRYRATESVDLSFAELVGVAWKMLCGEPYHPPKDAIRAMFAHRPLPDGEFEDLYKRFTPESLYAIRQLYLSEVEVDPERIEAPRLVIGTGKDAVIDPSVAAEVAEFLEVKPTVFPEFGHFFVKEPGWEKIADHIARWLALRGL